MKHKLKPIKLIVSLVASYAAGFLGSMATTPNVDTWFQTITQPSFAPPDWVFGPVWTILYAMIGVSLYLVWEKGLKKHKARIAIWLFVINILTNATWSIVFFGLHDIALALFNLVFIWLLTLCTVVYLYKDYRASAWLLVPYWLWLSFAMLLNLSILMLN